MTKIKRKMGMICLMAIVLLSFLTCATVAAHADTYNQNVNKVVQAEFISDPGHEVYHDFYINQQYRIEVSGWFLVGYDSIVTRNGTLALDVWDKAGNNPYYDGPYDTYTLNDTLIFSGSGIDASGNVSVGTGGVSVGVSASTSASKEKVVHSFSAENSTNLTFDYSNATYRITGNVKKIIGAFEEYVGVGSEFFYRYTEYDIYER